MGTGIHGGFGNTQGSRNEKKGKIYTPVQFTGSVKVDGVERDVSRRVYQRGDIDIGYVDPKTGKTNLELMQSGNAPYGTDGKPIELHHILQKESGPMVEIREMTHREYKKQLHGLRGPGESFRNDRTLLRQYNNFRKAYWKWRAQQIIGGVSL